MGAWSIGREPRVAVTRQVSRANLPEGALGMQMMEPGAGDPSPAGVEAIIDKITRWIPGDVLALYVAGVTALAANDGHPSIAWLVLGFLLTPAIVVVGAWSSRRPIDAAIVIRAGLAFIAFGFWSLTVPGSGWQRWDVVADNAVGVTLTAAVAGLFFGLVAERIAPPA